MSRREYIELKISNSWINTSWLISGKNITKWSTTKKYVKAWQNRKCKTCGTI